ncbi:hypothetical protein JOF41_001243 [Saccharothrix coeruleofusca]|uniref:hypothetical protein n=1 Tax=Saccharothrix coeruleofusca TaxID=33919 RepID=UPI001AE6D1C7|nr:hypothetical protein [Saccharothrix coeruleofusca]MBP2335065.1 hypothetical protein [Saccharothrix coeruleofusca]
MPKPVSEVCDVGRCEAVAKGIQPKIGGDLVMIRNAGGVNTNSFIGNVRKTETNWRYHVFLVKDGKAFDTTTGRYGMEIAEYSTCSKTGLPTLGSHHGHS